MKKQDAGMNLRSHSLDKLRQIITTGALIGRSRRRCMMDDGCDGALAAAARCRRSAEQGAGATMKGVARGARGRRLPRSAAGGQPATRPSRCGGRRSHSRLARLLCQLRPTLPAAFFRVHWFAVPKVLRARRVNRRRRRRHGTPTPHGGPSCRAMASSHRASHPCSTPSRSGTRRWPTSTSTATACCPR
jgi:hypothetical protein